MDIHTIHVEHALLLGLYTFLTLINSRLHLTSKGVHWFPIYNLCAFMGAVLIALRGHIPDPISIVAGTVFFPIGYVFLHRSLTEFFDRGAYQSRIQIGLVLIALASAIQYGVLHPNTQIRLIVYSLVLATQVALSARFVFREATGYLRVAGSLMGVVLSMLVANNIIRALGTTVYGAPANYLRSGSLLAWSILEVSVLQGAVTVAFVWMTAATLREDLRQQASTDPLTGVLNRRAVELVAERAIAFSQSNRYPFSVILIDLDRFKQINDSLGHQFGDATLVAVVRCLQRELRKEDILARIGGDEFVVLLSNTNRTAALETAERLRNALEQLTIVHGQTSATISASFGLAQLEHSTRDWDHLISNCDKALYSVKAGGGNLVATT